MLRQYFQECVLGSCLQIFLPSWFPSYDQTCCTTHKGRKYVVGLLSCSSAWLSVSQEGRSAQQQRQKKSWYTHLKRRENNAFSSELMLCSKSYFYTHGSLRLEGPLIILCIPAKILGQSPNRTGVKMPQDCYCLAWTSGGDKFFTAEKFNSLQSKKTY